MDSERRPVALRGRQSKISVIGVFSVSEAHVKNF